MNIEQRIKEAYSFIDKAQNYKIPKLQSLRIANKRMKACSICGEPFIPSYGNNSDKCLSCRKTITIRNRKKAKARKFMVEQFI